MPGDSAIQRGGSSARALIAAALLVLLATSTVTDSVEAGSAGLTDAHWAFRPVARPAVPEHPGVANGRNPIDHFVLARLAHSGLGPSPEAERRTLIRRLSFDLTGLPPAPEEVEQFV